MTVRVAAVFLALAVTSAMAQPPDAPEPPPGANSWSLRIHTTGGFTGMGVGSVTISSDGRMVCPEPCAALVEAQMKLISNSVASIQEAAWVPRVPTGFCRDCVFTTVVLKRREGDGVRTYIASWDDSQSATPELRELRRLALELRSERSAR